jgi:hypothetical protein
VLVMVSPPRILQGMTGRSFHAPMLTTLYLVLAYHIVCTVPTTHRPSPSSTGCT